MARVERILKKCTGSVYFMINLLIIQLEVFFRDSMPCFLRFYKIESTMPEFMIMKI